MAKDVNVKIDYTIEVREGENILIPELRGRNPKDVDVEIEDITSDPNAEIREVRVHGRVRSTT